MLAELIGRAYAVSGSDLTGLIIKMPTGGASVWGYVATFINVALLVAGVVAVVYLIYGGLLYITAGGDAEKATKGRTAIVNAIIGIIIIALAFLIVLYINNNINPNAAPTG